MSSKRLTRAQREAIIIDYINGKETPGYKVIEGSNGKFTVRTIKEVPKPVETKPVFEIEEEDANETSEQPESKNIDENDSKQRHSEGDDDYESLKQPVKDRSKQNARELLQQLSQLLNDDDEQVKAPQYIEKRHPAWETNWRRKKLVLN